MGGAGLNADLAQAGFAGRKFLQLGIIAIHIGAQFRFVGVMSTYFADLAANGDRHIFWLVLADKCRELRGQLIIQCLLFRDGWFMDVYNRGWIYIDIIKTGSDRFDRQKAYSLQFPLRVCGIFLRRDLEMIALYEHRAAKSLA